MTVQARYRALNTEWKVDHSTAEEVEPGIWFAWRAYDRSGVDIRNGLFWDDESTISLATGMDLHSWDRPDFELYVFDGEVQENDIYCHQTFEAAKECAIWGLKTGSWIDHYRGYELNPGGNPS